MAKKSAHGRSIGFIDYGPMRREYFSDGKILENVHGGWRIGARVRTENGHTPESAFARALENRPKVLMAEYNDLLEALVRPLAPRQALHRYVNILDDDPDGLYVELQDSYDHDLRNVHLTLDECVALCAAHRRGIAAVEENNKRRARQASTVPSAAGAASSSSL